MDSHDYHFARDCSGFFAGLASLFYGLSLGIQLLAVVRCGMRFSVCGTVDGGLDDVAFCEKGTGNGGALESAWLSKVRTVM